MTTLYPDSVDSFTTKVDGVTQVLAAHVNDLQDSVVAIEQASFYKNDNLLYHSLTHDLWQEGTTFSDIADDTYVADLWNIIHIGTTPDITGEAGGTTDDFARCLRVTYDSVSSIAGAVQFLENKDTIPLRGKEVSISADLWATGITEMRMAVVVWTSTADTITSDIVGTWGSGNPVLATNWAYIGTPAGITVSGTKTRYKVEALTIPTNANNIGVFIWDSQSGTTGNLFNIANVKLQLGAQATAFVARPFRDELALCQRFLFQQLVLGDEGVHAWGWNQSTTVCRSFMPTPVTMRTTPTVTGGFLNVKSNGASVAITSFDTVALMNNGIRIRFNVAAGLTAAHVGLITTDTATAVKLNARL